MIYIVQNMLPILLATLAGLAFGAAWYALGRQTVAWRSPGFLVTAFIAEFWFAAILAGALILAPPGKAGEWPMAIGTAVVIWIGFLVPALTVTLRARGIGWRGVAFDCGRWLGVMLVQAAVLKLVGLTAPPA